MDHDSDPMDVDGGGGRGHPRQLDRTAVALLGSMYARSNESRLSSAKANFQDELVEANRRADEADRRADEADVRADEAVSRMMLIEARLRSFETRTRTAERRANEAEELRKTAEALLAETPVRVLTCSICLEAGGGGWFVAPTCGHVVCNVCGQRLVKCPQCRSDFTDPRRIFVN
jgi:hypothetical protein